MDRDFNNLSKQEKIIFIWIRHLRYEFIEFSHFHGYNKVINNIINPIEANFKEKKFTEIINLCNEGAFVVKELNGNHFHILLFIDLKEMVSELL